MKVCTVFYLNPKDFYFVLHLKLAICICLQCKNKCLYLAFCSCIKIFYVYFIVFFQFNLHDYIFQITWSYFLIINKSKYFYKKELQKGFNH